MAFSGLLERTASSILSRYLGAYVVGLESENWQISVASGLVELHNLRLKKTALDDVDLPIKVIAGSLGHLRLKIPWTDLANQPAVIELSRILIVAGPQKLVDYDEATEEKRWWNTKQRMLQIHEMMSGTNEAGDDESASGEDDGFFGRLITRVINNVQIFFNDVHFRYEDDVTDPQHPFACGWTLEHVHAQSMNDLWEPCFLAADVKLVHKLVSSKNFTVYWNTDEELVGSRNEDAILEYLFNGIHRSTVDSGQNENEEGQQHTEHDNQPPRFQYILSPVSTELKLTINKSNEPDMDIPKIQVMCSVEQVMATFAEKQYRDLLNFVEMVKNFNRHREYAKHRPINENWSTKARWRFVARSILSDIRKERQSWSWERIKQFSIDKREYIRLYAVKHSTHRQSKMTPEQIEDLTRLEKKYSFDSIVMFRGLASAYIARDKQFVTALKERRKAEGELAAQSSWFSRALNTMTWSTEEYENLELTQDVLKDLHSTFDDEWNKGGNTLDIPQEYIKHMLFFSVDGGSLLVIGADGNDLMSGAFTGLDVTAYNREDSAMISSNIKSVEMKDFFTENTRFPLIVSPSTSMKTHKNDDDNYFFSVCLELNPFDEPGTDVMVEMSMSPLDIVVARPLLDRMMDFFVKPIVERRSLRDLELAMYLKMQAIRRQTEMQLQEYLSDRKNIAVVLDIATPNLIIPEDASDDDSPLLVLALGSIAVTSNLGDVAISAEVPKEGGDEKIDLESIDCLYNKYTLELTRIFALMTRTGAFDIKKLKAQANDESFSLIQPFDVTVSLELCRIQANHLPMAKISFILPIAKAYLTAQKVADLLCIALKVVIGDEHPATPELSYASHVEELAGAAEEQGIATGIATETVVSRGERLFDVFFEIQEVDLYLHNPPDPDAHGGDVNMFMANGQLLVTLGLSGLKGYFRKTSQDTQIEVSLHALAIVDNMQDYGEEFRYIAASWQTSRGRGSQIFPDDVAEELHLIMIQYRGTPKPSPLYRGTEHAIDAKLATLFVMCNPMTVVALYEFVMSIYDDYDERINRGRTIHTKPLDEIIHTGEAAQSTFTTAAILADLYPVGKASSAYGDVFLSFKAQLQSIQLTLQRDGSRMSHWGLGTSDLSIKVDETTKGEEYVEVQGTLGALTVDYLEEPICNHHRRILEVRGGEELVDFKVIYYYGDDYRARRQKKKTPEQSVEPITESGQFCRETEDNGGICIIPDDFTVQLHMKSVRFVYIQEAVSSLLHYLDELEVMRELAARQAYKLAEVSENKQMGYNVVLDNPYIVFPRHVTSQESVAADLGKVTLRNTVFRNVDASKGPSNPLGLIFRYDISLVDMNLSHILCDRPDFDHKIVTDSTILLKAERPDKDADPQHKIPEWEVWFEVPLIGIQLSEEKFLLLRRVLEDNICELVSSKAREWGNIQLDEPLTAEAIRAVSNILEASSSRSLLDAADPNTHANQTSLRSPQQSETANEVFVTYRAHATLHEIVMELLRGSGKDEEGASTSLFSGTISKLVLDVDLLSDGRINGDFFINSLEIIDTRAKTDSVHKTVFKPREAAESPSVVPVMRQRRQFTMQYQRKVSGHQLMKVHIDHPFMVMVPEIWVDAYCFIMPLKDQLLQTADVWVTYIHHDEEAQAAPAVTKFDIGLNVTNPEACFIESPTKANTSTFVFRATFDAQYSTDATRTQDIRLTFRRVIAYKCRLQELSQSFVSIVEPFDIRLRYQGNPLDTIITSEVDPINIMFSYRDYQLILSVVLLWYPVLFPPGEGATPEEELRVIKAESDSHGDVRLSTVRSYRSESTDRGEESTGSPMNMFEGRTTSIQRFDMTTSSIRLALINDLTLDSRSNPLLVLSSKSAALHAASWSTDLICHLSVSGAVDYFNNHMEAWEPVVEQFDLMLNVNRTRDGFVHGVLSAESRVNINLTKAFVETTLNTIDAVKEALEEEGENEEDGREASEASSRLSPYVLENETGYPLWYKLSHSREMVRIKAGESTPLAMSDSQRGGQRARLGVETLSVRIEAPEFTIDEGLPIERVGCYRLRVSDMNVATHEVALRRGSKVVTIRSRVIFRNDTTHPLDCLLQADDHHMSILENIKPASSVSIPLRFVPKGLVRICPKGNSHMWCERPISMKDYLLRDKVTSQDPTEPHFMLCKPCKSNIYAPFFFFVRCQTLGQDVVISIHPPLVIENLLPIRSLYKISELQRTDLMVSTKRVSKGEEHHLHDVDVRRNYSFQVQLDEFGWCDPIVLECKSPFSAEIVCYFNLEDGNPLVVKLDSERHSYGTRSVRLFVDFWMINRTGLRLMYKTPFRRRPCAGQKHAQKERWHLTGNPEDWYRFGKDECRRIFMWTNPPSYNPIQRRQRLCIKIAESKWSEPVNLANEGTEGTIEIEDSEPIGGGGARDQSGHRIQAVRLFELAVSISAGPGKFWRSKHVTISPRYILFNNSKASLCYRQQGRQPSEFFVLGAKKHLPFHWFDVNARRRLQIRLDPLTCEEPIYDWSPAFAIDQLTALSVKMRGILNIPPCLVKVHMKLDGATTLIVVSPEDLEYPEYKIENRTKDNIVLQQKGCEHSDFLPAEGTLPYAWDDPSARNKTLLLQFENTNEIFEISLEKMSDIIWTIKETRAGPGQAYHASVLPDGPSRLLKIEDQASRDKWEVIQAEEEKIFYDVSLSIQGFGLSLVDETPVELMYLSIDQIDLTLRDSSLAYAIEFKVSRLQIDNQLYGTPYPVLAYPVLPPETPNRSDARNRSFIHFTSIKNNQCQSIDYFKYMSALLGELDVRMDEEFLLRLLGFIDVVYSYYAKEMRDDDEDEGEVGDFLTPHMEVVESKMLYFECFHLNPVKINLTFTTTPGIERDNDNALHRLLSAGRLLANIDAAPLTLNSLLLEHAFSNRSDFLDRLLAHYQASAIRSWHRVLGSAEFLGSPISLVNNLGTGVYDFFYEPAQGLVSSPKDFGLGIAKGGKSLVKNSVYGIFNTTSNLTGTLGKTIGLLSFDQQYLRERDQRAVREKPENVVQGLGYGMRDFGAGIFDGLTGVATQPVKGVIEEGAVGFFKGLARGVSGVLVKPTVGTIDLFTRTSEGIKNTTTAWDERLRKRFRLPRYIGPDRILVPFSSDQAEGMQLMWAVEKGRWAKDSYHFHCKIGNETLLITGSVVILIKENNELAWICPIMDIVGLQLTTNHLLFLLSKENRSWFLGKAAKVKYIPGPLCETRSLYRNVVGVLKVLKGSERVASRYGAS